MFCCYNNLLAAKHIISNILLVLLLVKVSRPTWHKTGHFRDVPQANLLAWYGKTKANITQACIHQSNEMYYNTK